MLILKLYKIITNKFINLKKNLLNLNSKLNYFKLNNLIIFNTFIIFNFLK